MAKKAKKTKETIEIKETGKCCFCDKVYENSGHNTVGYWKEEEEKKGYGKLKRCCDECYETKLLPALKEKFLKTEFFILSWEAAVQQRNEGQKLFKDGISDDDKYEFKRKLFEKTETILNDYENNSVKADVHHGNLLEIQGVFKDYKEKIFGDNSYAFNFSTAQKYFNMMCKYYWCAGFIEEPPELPIDSINLAKIGRKDEKWTKKIKEIPDYEEMIMNFRSNESVLNEGSLAVWELKNWERRGDLGQFFDECEIED